MRPIRLVLAGLIVATVCSADAAAGQKLYDMSIFLRHDRGAPVAQPKPVSSPAWTSAPLPTRTAGRPRDQLNSGIADIFSELVIGFWRHDPEQDNNESDTLDLNAEIIFRKVRFFELENPIADFLLSPRPLIGGSVNNKNKTHTAYAALNWRYIFGNNVFIAGSFGFTYHTGNLQRQDDEPFDGPPFEVTLGSRFLFRESIAMGYRFADRHSVSLYAAHMSNGVLDDDNDGMNFVGIRYGYSPK